MSINSNSLKVIFISVCVCAYLCAHIFQCVCMSCAYVRHMYVWNFFGELIELSHQILCVLLWIYVLYMWIHEYRYYKSLSKSIFKQIHCIKYWSHSVNIWIAWWRLSNIYIYTYIYIYIYIYSFLYWLDDISSIQFLFLLI